MPQLLHRWREHAPLAVKDGERTMEALKGFEGKRLMYRDPIGKDKK